MARPHVPALPSATGTARQGRARHRPRARPSRCPSQHGAILLPFLPALLPALLPVGPRASRERPAVFKLRGGHCAVFAVRQRWESAGGCWRIHRHPRCRDPGRRDPGVQGQSGRCGVCPEDRGVLRRSVAGPPGCPRPVVTWCVPAFERPSCGERASGVPGAFVKFFSKLR